MFCTSYILATFMLIMPNISVWDAGVPVPEGVSLKCITEERITHSLVQLRSNLKPVILIYIYPRHKSSTYMI